jgi:cytochrome c peroxidase
MKTKANRTSRSLAWFVGSAFALTGAGTAWAQLQQVDPALLPAAEPAPLNHVTVPDINRLGLLDGGVPGWPTFTQQNQRTALQAFGKALFWDMQVGGDGIQACATCHFHAGADHRITGQGNPGQRGGDNTFDFLKTNEKLTRTHFAHLGNQAVDAGLPVNEAALMAAGATPDDQATGKPGLFAKVADPLIDTNDLVSSAGIRKGEFEGLGNQRSNRGVLLADGVFHFDFTGNAPGIPDTVRQVPPRNTPSALNAVYNMRNFWDGRADTFFNGVNPLGVRDPNARIKTYVAGALLDEKVRVPFSSLASQAVGPLGSTVEVIFDGRNLVALGRLLTRPTAVPLSGQRISPTESLLGPMRNTSNNRGLATSYNAMIRQVFDQRFWGDGNGNEVCVKNGAFTRAIPAGTACPSGETSLMATNFSLFFGLGVQAYEATLVTGETIVDLLNGGVATGTVAIGAPGTANYNTVNVAGLTLESCGIALAGLPNGRAPTAARLANADAICERQFAKFVPRKAYTGSASADTANPLPAGTPIGGCPDPLTCARSPNEAAAVATLRNVAAGLGSFSGGGRGCALCHGGPEFTVATVGAITGFGAVPELPEPGEPPEAPEPVVPIERMAGFDGTLQAYDAGFYNIGVRPTIEDIGLGGATDGVPMSWAKMLEIFNGGSSANGSVDGLQINNTRNRNVAIEYTNGSLKLPDPVSLAPVPFRVTVGCDPAIADILDGPLVRPDGTCLDTLVAGERISRNGSFKTPGLRNVKFTGPYMHNGSKANLRQVMDFYQTAGHFSTVNNANLHEAIRPINLGIGRQAEIIEFMETGLTDWRVAYQQAPFDHPELCLPHGHDPVSGKTVLRAIPAVGNTGSTNPIPTFEEMLAAGSGAAVPARANLLTDACTVTGVADANGLSRIDVPPSNVMPPLAP